MKSVKFHPWIGKNYERGLYGLKILALGESHYGEFETLSSSFTRDVINDTAINGRHRFFTTTAKAISLIGKKRFMGFEETEEFWNNITFYNYVQEILPKSRKAPSQVMWQQAQEPFEEVIEALKPDLTIILGKGLGGHVKTEGLHGAFCQTNHPSSGFRYETWIPVIEKAVMEAGGTIDKA